MRSAQFCSAALTLIVGWYVLPIPVNLYELFTSKIIEFQQSARNGKSFIAKDQTVIYMPWIYSTYLPSEMCIGPSMFSHSMCLPPSTQFSNSKTLLELCLCQGAHECSVSVCCLFHVCDVVKGCIVKGTDFGGTIVFSYGLITTVVLRLRCSHNNPWTSLHTR